MPNLTTSSPALSGVVPERTIPFDKFRESLVGSWILFLEQDDRIKNKVFPPDNNSLSVAAVDLPDREVDFLFPSIMITRLSENIKSGRIGDEFTRINRVIEGDTVETVVYSKRFICSYQFDLLTRDLPTQFDISSYLDQKFQGVLQDGTILPSQTISFAVKDFSGRLGNEVDLIPDSDVRVFWRPYKNVSTARTSSFNTEFEQLTYTIDFWSDFWYTKDDLVITNFETVYKDFDGDTL